MPTADRMRRGRLPGWLLAASVLAACASTEGPEFARPTVPLKSEWSQSLGDDWSIEKDWWRRFGDEDLADLITTAVDGNTSLDILAARTEQAQAFIGQAQSRLLPNLSAGVSTNTAVAGGSPSFDQSQFNLGSEMSWELDVWGRARKGVAAQEAAFQATLADWRAGHLALVSDVATAYLQLRLIDERIDRQERSIARGAEILQIYTDLHERGLIAETIVLRQRSEVSSQRAEQVELRRSRDLTVNGLATLLGEPAGNLRVPGTTSLMQIQPVGVPAGLPADILARRPDIVAAEYRLLQAVNLGAEARLARLPSIGLTGVGGTAAFNLNEMFRTVSGSLTSFVRFPVFDPNVRARIRVSEAQINVAEAEYRDTVIRAFEEVENALTNIARRKEQIPELENRVAALRSAEENTQARLEIGEISQLEVLEGQRSLLDAEQQVLVTRWQILIDTVTLFKALGGGWPPEQVGMHSLDTNAADPQASIE